MDSLLGRILKLIFGSIVVGLFSGLIIPRVINAFSSDGSFELSELLLTFLIIIIILVFLVRFLTHHLSRIIAIKPHIDFNFTQFKFLSIPGVLTGIIPMGGGLFGGSGNEPIWIFILLGIVGSLFWSIPLFLWLFSESAENIEDVNRDTFNLVSREKRLVGFLIDGLINILLLIPISIITTLGIGDVVQEHLSNLIVLSPALLTVLIGGGVFLILNGYLLFKRGQTIGKVVVKTRIVDLNGNIPNFGKLIVLRYLIFILVSLIPIIGVLVGLGVFLIFFKERRCLHDYIAGTRVVDV